MTPDAYVCVDASLAIKVVVREPDSEKADALFAQWSWTGALAASSPPATAPISVQNPVPRTYTPPYLVEQILSNRHVLEGERKQVTVLFADLRGSMELLAYYEQALVALEHVPDSRATTAWASCIARPAVVNWPELSYQRLLRYIAPWTWPSGCPISRQPIGVSLAPGHGNSL